VKKLKRDCSSHEITERIKLPRKKSAREIGIRISSWAGLSLGAVHYYAEFMYFIPDFIKIKVTKKVVGKPIKHIGVFGPDRYEAVGSYTDSFDSEVEAIAQAKSEFDRIFGKGWIPVDEHSDEVYNFKAKIEETNKAIEEYQKSCEAAKTAEEKLRDLVRPREVRKNERNGSENRGKK